MSSSHTAPVTSDGAGQEHADASSARLPHLGGLDGLRAFAVIAVVVYHVLPPALGGGFIGVDVFFVISGFLITSLLLHERRATGTVRRGRFWMRRVRRLAPALVLMLLVCTAAAGVIGGDVLVGIGWQLLGGVTFGFNWLAIVNGSSYFASTAPELYRNLWSLAVEEQFYLIWPLALAVLFFVRPVARVFIVIALAAASALAMALLLQDGGDPTRVYFGTDTHSFGLLCGAALALGLAARRPRHPETSGLGNRLGLGSRLGLSAAAIALVLGLVAATVVLREDEPATYRGGLLAVTVATTLLIWVLTRAPWVGRWFDVAPLRYIGKRSYGIYLWHWPVLVLVAAVAPHIRADTPPYLAVAVLCLVLTGLASVLSYRWLEVPIRTLGFRGWLRKLGTSLRRGPALRRLAVVVAPVFVVALLAGSASAVASAPEQSSSELAIARGQQALAQATPTPTAPAAPAGTGGQAAETSPPAP
ncbi:MAG: acyltransferase, partial [Actinomycetota bacterium]|nr:acyltransferase [Actinomycetota bacterium]